MSSDVMGSQHCTEGERDTHFFKIPIIFCHWLSKICFKKKERWDAMHAVSINSYVPYWAWLCHDTLSCKYNGTKWQEMAP